MATVYVVTEGSYSDYHICCIYSTKEQADRHAELIYGNVEEYEIDDPELANPAPKTGWDVTLNETGDIEWESQVNDIVGANVRVGRSGTFSGLHRVTFRVTSYVSREHAIKLASELRQKWLVEQAANG